MSDIIPEKTPTKRRRYSSAFKAEILEACSQPGASVASIAMQHGINANLVHKWRRTTKASSATKSQRDFLPVSLPGTPASVPSSAQVTLELPNLRVLWPLEHIDRALPWLRELQL